MFALIVICLLFHLIYSLNVLLYIQPYILSGIICSMSHLVLLPRRGCLMPTSEEWLWDGVAIKATNNFNMAHDNAGV